MDFNEMLKELSFGSFGSFGLIDVFLALTVPAIFCVPVVFTYRRTQLHASFSPSFLLMLFMFASLSGGITLFIGENIARAFGLVGAMSIIRFRNALKEPIDAVFVLWALTIGMVCGAGYYLAAALITFTVAGITFLVNATGLANFTIPKTVMKVVTNKRSKDNLLDTVESKLNKMTRNYKMLHEMTHPEDSHRTHVYTMTPKRNIKVTEIEKSLEEIDGVKIYGSIFRPSVSVIE